MFENLGWNLQEHGLEFSRTAEATSGWKGAAVEADVIGEQQVKRTQSGSSSLEADAVGEHWVEGLKRTQAASSARDQSAAAEADANRGAAALHRELSGTGLLTQANEGEV